MLLVQRTLLARGKDATSRVEECEDGVYIGVEPLQEAR